MKLTDIVLPLTFLVPLSGCFRGLAPDKVVLAPDSPVMIAEGRGWVEAWAWDDKLDSLVYYGWINLEDYKGWTITKHDWGKEDGER